MAIERSIDYKEMMEKGFSRSGLSPEALLEVEALDLAVLALQEDPWFEHSFSNQGLTFPDAMTSVNSLESLMASVSINCNVTSDEGREHMVGWGRRIVNHVIAGIEMDFPHAQAPVQDRLTEFVGSCQPFNLAIPSLK